MSSLVKRAAEGVGGSYLQETVQGAKGFQFKDPVTSFAWGQTPGKLPRIKAPKLKSVRTTLGKIR